MYKYVKRALDIAAAFAGLLVLCPLFAAVWAVIRVDSPGKAVFSQWRVGKGHKLFKLYKFRTMYENSEGGANLLREEGQIFVQRDDDPRLTRAGAFLRKTSLDELPQLWNVLKGDMALIGPRPFVLAESNKLPPIALGRLNVLPGITGYAQAEGRSSAGVPDRIARDLYYVQHLSFFLDLRILIRTIASVLRRDDAC